MNRRIQTGYSSQKELDLETHLGQLKVLFAHVEKYQTRWTGGLPVLNVARVLAAAFSGTPEKIPNPAYPTEAFEDFVLRMIDSKKKLIATELGVRYSPEQSA